MKLKKENQQALKNNMDYKLKLMQILECFVSQEGVIFEEYWKAYGITEEEKKQIIQEWYKFKE